MLLKPFEMKSPSKMEKSQIFLEKRFKIRSGDFFKRHFYVSFDNYFDLYESYGLSYGSRWQKVLDGIERPLKKSFFLGVWRFKGKGLGFVSSRKAFMMSLTFKFAINT